MQRHTVHDVRHAELAHAVGDVVAARVAVQRMAAGPVGQVGTGQVGGTANALGQSGNQALDGQLAIEAVDRAARAGHPFDVVLMDLQMPRMGGHEAARSLRLRYPASELPIIALTAAALVSEREQALQAGMNDFVTKPIDPEQLLRALANAL